jgi:hypothetical protein
MRGLARRAANTGLLQTQGVHKQPCPSLNALPHSQVRNSPLLMGPVQKASQHTGSGACISSRSSPPSPAWPGHGPACAAKPYPSMCLRC